MKAVIFGATRGMGRCIAQRLAARGDSVFLLGRDRGDLERGARDCELRGAPAPVGTAACDLLEAKGFETALDAADAALGGFDCVIVTAAVFAAQDELEADPALTEQLLLADFTNTVLFCEAARRRLLAAGGGTLCVFSSVAGERGRKPIVLYGAAKAGLSHYLEGLDHRFHAQGLVTVCVKPGFVHTSMTAGLDPPPFAGEPDDVAREVVAAIDRGRPVVYSPGIWRLVMWTIRRLPRLVMRRISF